MEIAEWICNSGKHAAVDPGRGCGEFACALPELETTELQSTPRPRRKFRRWLLLAGLLGGLVWMNGPGLRWLTPQIGAHFLGKTGLYADFTVEGSISGGLSFTDIHLRSDGALGELTVERVTPVYRFSELLRGRTRGIVVDGAHVELRLGAKKPQGPEKPPADLDEITRSLRALRGRIIPFSIDLNEISLRASRDGKPQFALASSSLRHLAGEPGFMLNLGAFTDAAGRQWPARQSAITWTADQLALDRLDPLPGVGIRDLTLALPESGGPSVDAEIRINDAVFMLGTAPGFNSVALDLREGRLDSRRLLETFSLEAPVTATLTSFALNVENLLPSPAAATGDARLLLEEVAADGWIIPELSLDAGLQPDRATLAASGQTLGTEFSLNAVAPVAWENGSLQPGEIRGSFNVADVSKLLAGLAARIKALDPQAPAPQSMADGGFAISLQNSRPASAEMELTIKPADPQQAATLFTKASWRRDGELTASLETEGLKAGAEYQVEPAVYQAEAVMDAFNSARIQRWLAVFRAAPGGNVYLTGNWSGSGEIKAARHRGSMVMAPLEVTREGMPPIRAQGGLVYDWPAGFTTSDLNIQSGGQGVSADAALADGWLELSNLLWLDDGRSLAGGSAKLPVPADFSKWRDTLAHDARPLQLALESDSLPLALLKQWLPAAAKLDPRSTGRVSLKVGGSYAQPEVDAVLQVRDLRSPEQAKLPPADLDFTLAGRDGKLSLNGSVTAPDLPAATITAVMPFLPAAWADNPGSIRDEEISARVNLPRLDLARFASLVPQAHRISGVVTGNIEAAGKLGKPVVKGRLDLTNGGLHLKDERIAPLTGIGAAVDLVPERITLRELRTTMAGGTLRGGGTLSITGGKPGALDFRLTANHLPLLRNDSMIVRANADLRLAGEFGRASLTGSVGVVDSLFYRDIELLPIGSPFIAPSAAALPKIDAPRNPASALPEPFASWALNVTVRTENDFLIRGNLAAGKITGRVRLGGTLGNPAPDGEVKLSNLEAALPFSTIHVRSGTLRFTPETGFDPVLEIRGTSEPRPYRVYAYVHGRASNPQLLLTSSPPLPENEIMTLLATGTTTSGLEDSQAASSRALQLLLEETRRGRFGVGKRLRPLLGLLDRVDFSLAEADPYSGESYSTATLELTDRWFLSAGMGEDGDSRLFGIWRLTFH